VVSLLAVCRDLCAGRQKQRTALARAVMIDPAKRKTVRCKWRGSDEVGEQCARIEQASCVVRTPIV
jgi:hypothetical protein